MAVGYATADRVAVVVIFAVGGFVAGLIGRSAKAVMVPLGVAGGTALVLRLASEHDGPLDVSPAVIALLAIMMFGLVGVPTALVGAALGRRLWTRPHDDQRVR